MRIQHNIPAMNAYRNYNANTKALQGNLQKLSSGYKINKAGDDAAGLAISEKMRAQITGLEVAQKNAKDGISLVQTAEGALTEVHSMLNRMYSLSEQSANGTYEDEVDREQLQKEITSLSEEIDRIADSTNFNGKTLLDGKLGSSSGKGVALGGGVTLTKVDAEASNIKLAAQSGTLTNAAGNTVELNISYKEGNQSYSETFAFTVGSNGKLVASDGTEYAGTATTITAADIGNAMLAEINKSSLADKFTIGGTWAAGLEFESKTPGTDGPEITAANLKTVAGGTTSGGTGITLTRTAEASNEQTKAALTAYDGTNADAAVFTVNGQKYAITATATQNISGLDSDVHVIRGASATAAATEAAAIIAQEQGLSVSADTSGSTLIFDAAASSGGSGNGLVLQIGDTSDDYNKMTVAINDMHVDAMGIGSINIGDQAGASSAMTAIKKAINYVSNTRGDLGALQNRLDHTINNLSVQQENIQDAEATIRDVDVANEMMAYTKNNILVQSAQAMLAQANQLPQGVLQLLG